MAVFEPEQPGKHVEFTTAAQPAEAASVPHRPLRPDLLEDLELPYRPSPERARSVLPGDDTVATTIVETRKDVADSDGVRMTETVLDQDMGDDQISLRLRLRQPADQPNELVGTLRVNGNSRYSSRAACPDRGEPSIYLPFTVREDSADLSPGDTLSSLKFEIICAFRTGGMPAVVDLVRSVQPESEAPVRRTSVEQTLMSDLAALSRAAHQIIGRTTPEPETHLISDGSYFVRLALEIEDGPILELLLTRIDADPDFAVDQIALRLPGKSPLPFLGVLGNEECYTFWGGITYLAPGVMTQDNPLIMDLIGQYYALLDSWQLHPDVHLRDYVWPLRRNFEVRTGNLYTMLSDWRSGIWTK